MKKFYLHLQEKFSLGCHAKTSLLKERGVDGSNPLECSQVRETIKVILFFRTSYFIDCALVLRFDYKFERLSDHFKFPSNSL